MKYVRILITTCCVFFILFEGYGQINIGGPAMVCFSPESQYTYTAYGCNTGTTWTLPTNMVLVSGGNGQNFVTVKYSALGTGMTLSVTCTEGSATLPINVIEPPSGNGVLSGPSLVSAGQSGVVYSLSGISPVTNYSWTVPSGATITSGGNTNTITVTFPSNYGSGNISVVPVNQSCFIPAITMAVATGPSPSMPGAISGNTFVTRGSTNYTYSVGAVSNATSYQWSLPSNATLVSGAGTNSVQVNFSTSFTGGNLTVKALNGYVVGPTSPALYVTPTGFPSPAGAISGSDSHCVEYAELTASYSVGAISGATSYSWTVTGGASIVGNNTSSTVEIKFPANVQSLVTITVKGVNASGSGATSSKTVTINRPVGNVGATKIEPSVDLTTGIMSTSIPLFSISSGDIQVPVVLSYSATGVRVTDDDGTVGHNWNLSALNYGVSREVRGLPDDYSGPAGDNRKGWLINNSPANTIKNFVPTTDNNAATCSDEVANYTALSAFDFNTDTEPDIFYANAPGLSFQFYFDETKTPRAVPYQDVIITPNTTTGPISSFTVRDSRGILYTFSEVETWTQSLQTASSYYLVRQTNQYKTQITYTTSWRLSSISSPTYGTVSFTYKTVNLNDPALIPQAYHLSGTYKYNYAVVLKDTYSYPSVVQSFLYNRQSVIKILQKVSSSDMEAVFTSSQKSSTSLLERLNAITLYDKREGTAKLVRSFSLWYDLSGTDRRAFLAGVSASSGCDAAKYTMEYYPGVLPLYDNTSSTDAWGFYKTSGAPYDETVSVGSLKKITYPYKGYDVFFYEPHTYFVNGLDVTAAGLRLKKMISYDGVSSANDRVLEYSYEREPGNMPPDYPGKSSGILQYRAQNNFAVTTLHNGFRYRDYPSSPSKFTLKSSLELSMYRPFRGSAIAYERVIVKEHDAGRSVYLFDFSSSSEWEASKISVARPAVNGTSNCFELGDIMQAAGQYPFPPDPNDDFAKALLKRVISYREDGVKERDVVLTYQRVFRGGGSIRKIYGLALEELPTYYYNGSTYQSAKMFLYSKYEILTDVRTELASQTETIYNTADEAKKSVTTTNYFFDSPNHGELSRIETLNSDGSLSRKKIKYSKDYTITSASGTPAVALASLNNISTNRMAVVETISSKVTAGVEKTIGANLNTYQTINGKVYPHQQYSFASIDGTTTFVPSSISGGSTFQFDQSSYALDNTVLSIDNYSNISETVGKDKVVHSVAFGYGGTLPIIQVSNAAINEMRYSDFETSTPASSQIGWSNPLYVTGRNNSKALAMPVGSETNNSIANSLTHNNLRPRDYILSAWIKASSAGNLSIRVAGPGINSTVYTLPFVTSTDFKFYQLKIPVASMGSTGPMIVFMMWSNVAINIDDFALYPDQSEFITSTYIIPNGRNSQTDARGISTYFDYDLWGRLKAMYDQDKNVVKKIDYQVRP